MQFARILLQCKSVFNDFLDADTDEGLFLDTVAANHWRPPSLMKRQHEETNKVTLDARSVAGAIPTVDWRTRPLQIP